MARFLRDFPKGPLDRYRNRASFDWKQLKVFLETEEILECQEELYKELQQYPSFFEHHFTTPSLDEKRRITNKHVFILQSLTGLQRGNTLDNLRKPAALYTTLFWLDPAASIKWSVSFGMFPSTIQSLGTQRHLDYVEDSIDGNITGAFCLTEIGHGSNSKSMQATATYDKETKEFVLNSPNFEAAKCWAGALGQVATHAVVFAQLVTPDGVRNGLHAFVVKLRDPKTLRPYPGIIVGDMGEKIGLNGIDNGFLIFQNYRIPRSALLNKTGDVMENGRYVTPFRDPNKRHGASLGALSMGRISITNIGTAYAAKALTIAIRYAAIRKQFGPEGDEEQPILEYQSHQHRLLPYLAAAYAFRIFCNYIMEVQYQFAIDSIIGQNKDLLPDLGLELHAISSACKPVAGWTIRDIVQECREACAGHGYLKASGLGDLKNDHDANCTYEGENHILIQQTSNWLLKLWTEVLKGEKITFPLKSVDFLTNAQAILGNQFSARTVEDLATPNSIFNAYQWLVCYLLKATHEKNENLLKQGLDPFTAKNESQVYYAKNLGIAYIQHYILQQMQIQISQSSDPQITIVLSKLFALYGVWCLEKHLGTFYQGGYAVGPMLTTLLQESILTLCRDIKNDAVSLIDVIAPPDFLMNSVLGRSDGLVYEHLEATMLQAPGALSRPSWWKEVAFWKDNLTSKL